MFIDARTVPNGEKLAADLCIVGGGAAGITLAHELADSGLSVILAEAGDEEPATGPAAVLADPLAASFHQPRGRGMGGDETRWNGRCRPFDALDFEIRPWLPHSGWPLPRRTLDGAYARALGYCQAGRMSWHSGAALREGTTPPATLIPGFDDPELLTESLERFSPPTRFGRRFRQALAAAAGLRVLTHATCLRIGLSAFGNQVEVLHFASRPNRQFTVRPRCCVLAAGTLETTRLLLASDDVMSTGVGNRQGLVGRFLMAPLQGRAALVLLHPAAGPVACGYERDAEGVYCRRLLSLLPEVQRRDGLQGFTAGWEPPPLADPAHGSAVLSALWLARPLWPQAFRRAQAAWGRGGEAPRPALLRLAGHLRNLGADAGSLPPALADWLRLHPLAPRRRPALGPPLRGRRFLLSYLAEQRPDPANRVELTAERDRLGRRRLKLIWRPGAADLDSLVAAHRLIDRRLRAAGLGRLGLDEEELRAGCRPLDGTALGTARMAEDPAEGVVDGQGRVFGIHNLFIASGAIFPTSGATDPTLTVVALACRLADHLRDSLRRTEAAALSSVSGTDPV